MEVLEDYIVIEGDLKDASASESKNLLFLIPSIMDTEIEKIKDICPIYRQVTEKGISYLFYDNIKRFTDEYLNILYNLPSNIVIPIGTVTSPYILVREENEFGIVNRYTNIMMISKSYELKYFGEYVLLQGDLHTYLINENGPILLSGEIVKIDMPNECVCTKDVKNNSYYLCTNTGNFIARSDKFWELYRLALKENNVQKEQIDLPKDITMFEQMIIKNIKSIPKLHKLSINNLFDLAIYTYNNGMELVIDLNTLIPHQVTTQKYIKISENAKSIWLKDEGSYTTNKLDNLVRIRRRSENA